MWLKVWSARTEAPTSTLTKSITKHTFFLVEGWGGGPTWPGWLLLNTGKLAALLWWVFVRITGGDVSEACPSAWHIRVLSECRSPFFLFRFQLPLGGKGPCPSPASPGSLLQLRIPGRIPTGPESAGGSDRWCP